MTVQPSARGIDRFAASRPGPSPASSTSRPTCPARPGRGRRAPGQAVGQREHPGLQPRGPGRLRRGRRPAERSIRTAAPTPCAPPSPSATTSSRSGWCSAAAPTRSSHLINQVFLEPGDNIVQGQYGFGAYAIGARAYQAEVRFAAEPNYRIDVDAMLALVDERTRLVFIANPANPTGTFIPATRCAACTQACRPAWCWCSTAPTPSSAATRPSTTAWTWRATPTTSSSPTPSPSCTAWPPCASAGPTRRAEMADAVDRIRLPFNTSIAGQEAADRRPRRRGLPGPLAGAGRALAAVADPAARRPGPGGRPRRRPTSSWSASHDPRPDGGRGRGLPRLAAA